MGMRLRGRVGGFRFRGQAASDAAPTIDLSHPAANDLLQFAHVAPTDVPFQESWHHALMAKWIAPLLRGEIRKLMLLFPVRHGKTRFCSHLAPVFALGHDPTEKILACSHTADLAQTNSRAAQRLIDSEECREVFPHLALNQKNIRTVSGSPLRNVHEWEPIDPRRGRRWGGIYKCAGVGGAIAGRGFTLGVVDDPIKGALAADSLTIRNRQWEWYLQEFRTRALGPTARLLWVATLWHEDDLSCRVLEHEGTVEEGGQWHVLRMPAILDDERMRHPDDPRELGEALWPGPPFHYTVEYLQQLRESAEAGMSTRAWEALYQQRPNIAGGNIWKEAYFHECVERPWRVNEDVLPRIHDGEVEVRTIELDRYATVDVALGKADGDWTVVAVWGLDRERKRVYLLDLWRERAGPAETLRKIQDLTDEWRLEAVYIESVQYQAALVEFARRESVPAREIKPDRDKAARLRAVEFWGEQGRVFHRGDRSWNKQLKRELLAFRGHKDDTDDQVDVWSYGVQIAIERCRQGLGAPRIRQVPGRRRRPPM